MPVHSPTSLASLGQGIVEWAGRQGIDRQRLLRATALDPHSLEDGEARLPGDAHVSLWQETERALSDPGFGIKQAESILSVSALGVVGLLAMTSENVQECFARSVRYARILKEEAVAASYVTGKLLVVEFSLPRSQPRAIVDVSLAAFRHFAQQWTGESIVARQVFFQHARPRDAPDYERLFACPIRFEHPTNAIVFDREIAQLPLVTKQVEVAAYLERVAHARLASLERASGTARLPEALTQAVRLGLQEGDVGLARVARRLGVSPRTLQRQLMDHGLEFRRVVDEVRWRAAEPLVTSTDLALERIAEQLGYSDAKAFRRAFRRWTGASPSDVRRRASRPPRPPPERL
jgi:AraC-like DNA-binding protein